MIVKLDDNSKSPFHVPSGTYAARLSRSAPAKKKHCKFCSLVNQVTLYFDVDVEEMQQHGVVSATRCVGNIHCINRLGLFMKQWMEDQFYDYVEEDGAVDLDRFLNKRADVVVETLQVYPYPHPYSKLACALPSGRLLDRAT